MLTSGLGSAARYLPYPATSRTAQSTMLAKDEMTAPIVLIPSCVRLDGTNQQESRDKV